MLRQRGMTTAALLGLFLATLAVQADEAAAIQAVQKNLGTVTMDESLPGKPVVVVDMHGSKVFDSALKDLKAFKSLQKLNLDLARVTDAGMKDLKELKSMQVTLPTMTFDRSLILHRPSKTVEILWLGNAHTNGDVFVYLPREKVLVTGDALHGWTPYMGDSYPFDWIKTLDAAEKLDFDQVIVGHGEVMRGKQKFALWKQYFSDLC